MRVAPADGNGQTRRLRPSADRLIRIVSTSALVGVIAILILGRSASGIGGVAAPKVGASNGRLAPATKTQGTIPPNNPSSNILPNPDFLQSCSSSQYDNSQGCEQSVLQAIDNARAVEGLPDMGLPTDWFSLSPAEQLYVATNLERTARGLPALSGMATLLDQAALDGAEQSSDPEPPSGFPWTSWGSNWAGAIGSSLEAIYFWMYDDGEGSSNVDCTSSNTSGCWGHRDTILMNLTCQPCVMGAALDAVGYQGYPSWAEILVDTSVSAQMDLLWSEVVPKLADPPGTNSGTFPGGNAPAIAFGPTGLPIAAAQGPGDALWVYWEDAGGQWQGPLGVGGPGSTSSSPAMVIGASGFPIIMVQGPDNSLWEYWEDAGGQWQGPLGVGGPGSTMSSPSVVVGPTGLPVVTVQGSSNTLLSYWEIPGGQWQGPLGIGGPGSTNSAPATVVGTTGLPVATVQGPDDSLWAYWVGPDGQWAGPLGVGGAGSSNSSPSLIIGTTGLPVITVQGPDDSLWAYWENTGGQWTGPLGVGAPGSTNSAPAMGVGSSGLPVVMTQGPDESLWAYWEAGGGQWKGPLSVGAPGSTT